MKEFKDLIVQEKQIGMTRLSLDFDNGYGISVIQGKVAYTNGDKEWEVAVIKKDRLCYTTSITDDVIGYLSSDEVTEIMRKIQELKMEDEELKEMIIDGFSEIVKNETIKTESLKALLNNIQVAKIEIESGIDVQLDLGLLEFVR